MAYGFGIDIGGTKCAVTLADFRQEGNLPDILERRSLPSRNLSDPDAMISMLIETLDDIAVANGVDIQSESIGIGISCGGPLDSERGVIMQPPNLSRWKNVPIVRIFSERYGVDVFLENDANACALAEYEFGAGVGRKNIIFLTFGTGLGAGLILDGRIYRGANGMAGEVGHVRLSEFGPVGYGKSGSFEGFCSGEGIRQIARMKLLEAMQRSDLPSWCDRYEKIDQLNAKVIAEQAQAGDPVALDIYRTSGIMLGKGLAILVDILNPEMIIIGSIFCRSHDLLWPSAEAMLRRESLSVGREVCEVVPAKLGERVGDYAALSLLITGKR